eukprot:ANDGO_00888.mRNA.1 Tetracycline resistance protein
MADSYCDANSSGGLMDAPQTEARDLNHRQPVSFWKATWLGGRFHFSSFLYIYGQVIYTTLLPALIRSVYSSTSEATIVFASISAINIFLQFAFLPLMGVWADRFGRKKMLLLGAFGMFADACLASLVLSKSTVFFVFIGRSIQGFCGGFQPSAQSVMADISTPDDRSSYYGALTVFGNAVAIILGAFSGGLLASTSYSFNVLMLISAGIELLLVVFLLVFVRETLQSHKRRPIDWKKANPVGSFQILFTTPFISGVLFILIVVAMALACFNSISYFYMVERYDASVSEYGMSLVLWASVAVFSSAVSPWICKKTSERFVLQLGLCCGALASFGCSAASTLLVYFLFVFLFGFIMFAYPAYLAIVSRQITPSRQAEILSGGLAVALVAQGFGILIMSGIFAFSVSLRPSLPWLVWTVSGVLLFAALLCTIPYFRKHPDDFIRIADPDIDDYQESCHITSASHSAVSKS